MDKLNSIHQTKAWGQFQTATPGRSKFWELSKPGIYSALVIKQTFPFGLCWLYSPRGPILDYTNSDHLSLFFKDLKALAKEQNAVLFRFDPSIDQVDADYLKVVSNLKKLNSKKAHAHYQPESTLVVNLDQSEEQILAQMKPKGRYNIKVAERHGVIVRSSNQAHGQSFENDLKKYSDLLNETTKRDKFSGHSIEYYKNMIKTLGAGHAKLWLAEYQNQVVAAAIITYFKDTSTYYFGVSSNQYRNTMAPYLLHWQIMKDAKAAGYKIYDFFGIATPSKSNPLEHDKDHPWASVTDFKLKFGGQRINYLPAQEIIFKPVWYQIIKTTKLLKKLIRH